MGGRARKLKLKNADAQPRPSTSAASRPTPLPRDPRASRQSAGASLPLLPVTADLDRRENYFPTSEEQREGGTAGKRGPPSPDEGALQQGDPKKACQEESSDGSSSPQEASMTSGTTTEPSPESYLIPHDLEEKLKAFFQSPHTKVVRSLFPSPEPTSQHAASFADIAASTPARPASPRTAPPAASLASSMSVEANANAEANANTDANATAPRQQCPPIVAEKLPNWPQHFKLISEELGHLPNARPFGDGVRFLPKTPLEFRVIQRHLTEASKQDSGIHWYCFSVPQELPTKVALRGLPTSTDEDAIKTALEDKGFEVTHVRRIPFARGRPGCIYHVQLKHLSQERLQELYNTTEFLYMAGVKFEGWRGSGGVAQCHRCQAFGHSSHNCHRPPRCVRCAGEHIVADCPRARDEPATCANCGKPHAANNRHCKAYRKEARLRNIIVRPPPPPRKQSSRAPMPSRAERRYRQRPEEDQPPQPPVQTVDGPGQPTTGLTNK